MHLAHSFPATSCRVCGFAQVSELCRAHEWQAYAQNQSDARHMVAALFGQDPRFHFERFFRCDDCGSAFVSPIPSREDLTYFYKSYYANGGYLDKAEKKLKRSLGRIRQIQKHVKTGRFLDIGCNVGYMVEAARQRGFSATGIEIDPDAVEVARQQYPLNTFLCTDIAEFAKTGQQFDAINCSEVIEHVPDIAAFVKALTGLCSPKGIIYITTPDVGAANTKKRFIAWNEVKPPEHLQWFSRKGIATVLAREGFQVQKFVFNLKPGIKLFVQRT